jgi:PhnB protein
MAAKPVPEEYHTVTPYLIVEDASAAIDFYGRALGAKERVRMPTPDGGVMHAEIEIGDSRVMLSEMSPDELKHPKAAGTTTVGLLVYTEDVDATHKQAVEAGATSMQEPEDQFWGDRFARIVDPFGHSWQLATHVEDVEPEEMERRMREAMAAMPG